MFIVAPEKDQTRQISQQSLLTAFRHRGKTYGTIRQIILAKDTWTANSTRVLPFDQPECGHFGENMLLFSQVEQVIE